MQWNLIRLRKENNYNQEDLAKVLNISTDTYGMKERGRLQFKADEMFTLSEFFGEDIGKIFLPTNFGNGEVGEAK